MGQVCARDDEVNQVEGNASTTVPQGAKQADPPGLKPASAAQQPPKVETAPKVEPPKVEAPKVEAPKADVVTPLAQSKIADVHVDAQNLEPYSKMNSVNQVVQRRLDGLKPIRAEDFPDLKAKYSGTVGQIVRDRKKGATYQGQMNRGVPHGWGKYVQADGGVIEGFFDSGHPTGYVRRFEAPNGVGYDGQFSNNAYNGRGSSYDEKGNVTECAAWSNGQTTGQVIIRSPTGAVLFQGAMVGGKKQGPCTWYNQVDKAELKGEFKEDFLEGRGTKRYDNGQLYEGDFRKGVEEGKGVLIMIDGRKFEGPFTNGKANGKGFLITDAGKRIEQTWKDGKRV